MRLIKKKGKTIETMNEEKEKKEKGFTVWLTGLPCSGKSTIASTLFEQLRRVKEHFIKLDADEVRKNLWPELGYFLQVCP